MSRKLFEERDIANKWRVWYEVTTADGGSDAVMFKFNTQPTDSELEAVVAEFVFQRNERDNKVTELEALRIQVAELEAQLNL
jgi:hypothetical protein